MRNYRNEACYRDDLKKEEPYENMDDLFVSAVSNHNHYKIQ